MKFALPFAGLMCGASILIAGCSRTQPQTDLDKASQQPAPFSRVVELTVGDEFDLSGQSTEQTVQEIVALASLLEASAESEIVSSTKIEVFSGACKPVGRLRVKRFSDYSDFLTECGQAVEAKGGNRWMPIGIVLTGEINRSTTEFFEYAYGVAAYAERAPYDWSFTAPTYSLFIDSPGGDVDQAFQAGDVVWNLFDTVNVVGSGCFSACVFILAAAKDKSILGFDPWYTNSTSDFQSDEIDRNILVGVHSPIPTADTKISAGDLAEVRADVAERAKSFVSKYGVSPSVVDLMMATPSGEIRFLSTSELTEIGLWGESVIVKDLDRMNMLRECGAEFEALKDEFFSEVERTCPEMEHDFDAAASCHDATAVRMKVTREFCSGHGIVLYRDIGWVGKE